MEPAVSTHYADSVDSVKLIVCRRLMVSGLGAAMGLHMALDVT